MKKNWIFRAAALGLLLAAMPLSAAAQGTVVGTAETLLIAMSDPGADAKEVPLGSAAADAVRMYAGTDAALIPGGCFWANLQSGEFTRDDVLAIFPGENALGTAEITAAQLLDMLEHSVSTFVVGEGDRVDYARSASEGFLQVSGITFRFDVSAPVGQRVVSAALEDGTALVRGDTDTVLTAAAPAELLEGGFGYQPVPYAALALSLPDALIWYASQPGVTLEPPEGERIKMIGSNDAAFLGGSGISSSVLVFLGCIAAIYAAYLLTLGRSPAWKALRDRTMPETRGRRNAHWTDD